jgi:hypothetical protein|tara:strand:+ start:2207 stop:2533 length:327 start_codon:yes stop_codon:yes gene_type:complete
MIKKILTSRLLKERGITIQVEKETTQDHSGSHRVPSVETMETIFELRREWATALTYQSGICTPCVVKIKMNPTYNPRTQLCNSCIEKCEETGLLRTLVKTNLNLNKNE